MCPELIGRGRAMVAISNKMQHEQCPQSLSIYLEKHVRSWRRMGSDEETRFGNLSGRWCDCDRIWGDKEDEFFMKMMVRRNTCV